MVCWDYPDDGSMPHVKLLQTWMPPSPPVSDSESDFYCDPCGQEWYEAEPMCESRLPSTIHELHRPRSTTSVPASTSQQTLPPASETEKAIPSSTEPMFSSAVVQEPVNSATPGRSINVFARIWLVPETLLNYCTFSFSNVNAVKVNTLTTADAIISQKHSGTTGSVFERERFVNVVPQAGVSNGAPFLDTSNLLRPPTPSQIVNTVDDAIDTVRRSHKVSSQRHSHSTLKGSYVETRNGKSEMRRPFTPPPRIYEASDYEGPEWTIIEDRALLIAVTCDQSLPYHLHSSKSGHIANWEYISAILLRISGHYRSPRQCCLRYQMIVIPREEGRTIALDPITKKTKKITVSSTELAHMKRGNTTTEQQYAVDASKILSGQTLQKFCTCKNILARRDSTNHLYPMPAASSLDGSLTVEQQVKLTEYGVHYQHDTYPVEVLDCQKETRLKLLEQDKEKQLAKEHEQQKEKETAVLKERNESNQKAIEKRESIFSSLSGMIKYQRASMAFMEQTSPHISVPVCATSSTVQYQNSGVRVAGNSVHSLQMASANSGVSASCNPNEMTQVVVGQRSYSDHQPNTVNAISNSHHATTRRVTLPPGALQSNQHQIVMSGGATTVQTSGQPYAVVVSQDSLSGSTQSANARLQFGNRSEGVVEQRQAVYRAVSIGPNKRPPSSSPVQRVGLSTGYSTSGGAGTSQIYTTSGRTVIVSNQGNEIPALNEQAQLQAMRPQVQSVVSAGQRQDVRPKIAQRTQNRVYITPSGPGSETRSYKLSPGPVRMLASSQRITQKRPTGALSGRSLNTQPQVTMTVRSGMQQVVGITRSVNAGYQGSRMPSIGVIMSGSGSNGSNSGGSNGSNVRSETFATTATINGQVVTTGSSGVTLPRQYTVNSQGQITRQLPSYSSQSNVSSASVMRSSATSSVGQDHYVTNVTVQPTQALPPISLSCHATVQRLNSPSTSAGGTGSAAGNVVSRQTVSLTNSTALSSSSVQQQSQTGSGGNNSSSSNNGHCSEALSSTTSVVNNGTSLQ
uniref:Myb-like domain-containing protein n=1 Tax=Syphacia muris TaxID=451379 RepID=A0A0N5AQE9_9BILA